MERALAEFVVEKLIGRELGIPAHQNVIHLAAFLALAVHTFTYRLVDRES